MTCGRWARLTFLGQPFEHVELCLCRGSDVRQGPEDAVASRLSVVEEPVYHGQQLMRGLEKSNASSVQSNISRTSSY